MKLGEYIREYRIEHNLSQRTFAQKCGLSNGYISMLESGVNPKTKQPIAPSLQQLDKLASAMGVSLSKLLEEVDDTPVTVNYIRNFVSKEYTPILIDDSAVVPVLGRVAAGIPMYAAENIIGQIRCSSDMAKDSELFALKISGVSMEPKIPNGSIVIVRKQDTAENGDIVIALVNGDDAVCKKYIRYENGAVALISLNLSYEPMVYESAAIDYLPVRIIGKVIEIRSTP